jgi:hypothetical protein
MTDIVPSFHAVPRDEVPVHYCAIKLNGEVLYVGRIKDSPTPPPGATMYLNPQDFELIKAWLKKKMH